MQGMVLVVGARAAVQGAVGRVTAGWLACGGGAGHGAGWDVCRVRSGMRLVGYGAGGGGHGFGGLPWAAGRVTAA